MILLLQFGFLKLRSGGFQSIQTTLRMEFQEPMVEVVRPLRRQPSNRTVYRNQDDLTYTNCDTEIDNLDHSYNQYTDSEIRLKTMKVVDKGRRICSENGCCSSFEREEEVLLRQQYPRSVQVADKRLLHLEQTMGHHSKGNNDILIPKPTLSCNTVLKTSNAMGKFRTECYSVPGVVFMCTDKVLRNFFRYGVLGLPVTKKDLVDRITAHTRLFLLELESSELWGIYEAESEPSLNIERGIYQGSKVVLPAQVRFRVHRRCHPLPESVFREVIKDCEQEGARFGFALSYDQVMKLTQLFNLDSKSRVLKVVPQIPFSTNYTSKTGTSRIDTMDGYSREAGSPTRYQERNIGTVQTNSEMRNVKRKTYSSRNSDIHIERNLYEDAGTVNHAIDKGQQVVLQRVGCMIEEPSPQIARNNLYLQQENRCSDEEKLEYSEGGYLDGYYDSSHLQKAREMYPPYVKSRCFSESSSFERQINPNDLNRKKPALKQIVADDEHLRYRSLHLMNRYSSSMSHKASFKTPIDPDDLNLTKPTCVKHIATDDEYPRSTSIRLITRYSTPISLTGHKGESGYGNYSSLEAVDDMDRCSPEHQSVGGHRIFLNPDMVHIKQISSRNYIEFCHDGDTSTDGNECSVGFSRLAEGKKRRNPLVEVGASDMENTGNIVMIPKGENVRYGLLHSRDEAYYHREEELIGDDTITEDENEVAKSKSSKFHLHQSGCPCRSCVRAQYPGAGLHCYHKLDVKTTDNVNCKPSVWSRLSLPSDEASLKPVSDVKHFKRASKLVDNASLKAASNDVCCKKPPKLVDKANLKQMPDTHSTKTKKSENAVSNGKLVITHSSLSSPSKAGVKSVSDTHRKKPAESNNGKLVVARSSLIRLSLSDEASLKPASDMCCKKTPRPEVSTSKRKLVLSNTSSGKACVTALPGIHCEKPQKLKKVISNGSLAAAQSLHSLFDRADTLPKSDISCKNLQKPENVVSNRKPAAHSSPSLSGEVILNSVPDRHSIKPQNPENVSPNVKADVVVHWSALTRHSLPDKAGSKTVSDKYCKKWLKSEKLVSTAYLSQACKGGLRLPISNRLTFENEVLDDISNPPEESIVVSFKRRKCIPSGSQHATNETTKARFSQETIHSVSGHENRQSNARRKIVRPLLTVEALNSEGQR